MTEAQRKQFFEIRRLMDKIVAAIPVADEAAFNAAAATINENAAAFRTWLKDADYKRGDVTIDPADGVPYWSMHDHGASTGNSCQPSQSPTMWTHCHGTTPETARPFVAEGHNPYMTGHYCTENGVAKRCTQDNIVYSPSVYPSAWE